MNTEHAFQVVEDGEGNRTVICKLHIAGEHIVGTFGVEGQLKITVFVDRTELLTSRVDHTHHGVLPDTEAVKVIFVVLGVTVEVLRYL